MAPESPPAPTPAHTPGDPKPCHLTLALAGYEMVQEGLALLAEAMPNPPEDLNPMLTARQSRLSALRATHAAIRVRREAGVPWDAIAREFGGRQTAQEMRDRFEEAAADVTLGVEQDTPEHRSASYAALMAYFVEVSAAHMPEGASLSADPLRPVPA